MKEKGRKSEKLFYRAVSKAIDSVQDIDRLLFDDAIIWAADMKK